MKWLIKRSYAFYLAVLLGFMGYGFFHWQFWAVILPTMILVEKLHK